MSEREDGNFPEPSLELLRTSNEKKMCTLHFSAAKATAREKSRQKNQKLSRKRMRRMRNAQSKKTYPHTDSRRGRGTLKARQQQRDTLKVGEETR